MDKNKISGISDSNLYSLKKIYIFRFSNKSGSCHEVSKDESEMKNNREENIIVDEITKNRIINIFFFLLMWHS